LGQHTGIFIDENGHENLSSIKNQKGKNKKIIMSGLFLILQF